ncbi:MAG: right-handed parallel beta-helix repeat-containing protein [Kiritimatiellae bacterium]|nr:right-handed parallel beta-helix repeat-containing protein [Kiritimatiellia bacterium]
MIMKNEDRLAVGLLALAIAAGSAAAGSDLAWRGWDDARPSGNTNALRAIPTYESLGLYLDAGAGEARVRYCRQGAGAWRAGLDLWDDTGRSSFTNVTSNSNHSRHRGSLVHLTPDTSYEVQVLHGNLLYRGAFRTLDDNFPVAKTIQIGHRTTPLAITEGGGPNGYVVYEGGSITLPMSADRGLVVDADYVIIRNTRISGPTLGIAMAGNRHDIVIERSEITDWGRFIMESDRARYGAASQYLGGSDEAILIPPSVSRVTIQYNNIHTPRTDSNTWKEMIETQWKAVSKKSKRCHPWGPRAIGWRGGAQRIIRYNTLAGARTHKLEDVIEGASNDSDVYGNLITGFADDAMEIDGTSRNVRVWNNRIHVIASDGEHNLPWKQPALYSVSPITVGPVYIWRNLATGEAGTRVIQGVKKQSRTDTWTPSGKPPPPNEVRRGRLYYFHNTSYSGQVMGSGFKIVNAYAYNNVQPDGFTSWKDSASTDFTNNLTGAAALGQLDGHFIVKPGTAGHDTGILIPNFNDGYAGSAPDMGYQEAGGAPLRVGHAGSSAVVTGAEAATAPSERERRSADPHDGPGRR